MRGLYCLLCDKFIEPEGHKAENASLSRSRGPVSLLSLLRHALLGDCFDVVQIHHETSLEKNLYVPPHRDSAHSNLRIRGRY